jgi:hypothetical protein
MMMNRMVTSFSCLCLLATSGACTSNSREERISEERPASPSLTSESVGVRSAEEIFGGVREFGFRDVSAPVERELSTRFRIAFERLDPVDVAAKRVVSRSGKPLPVRVVAVTYDLPADVPIEALAYEIGREFLGATPRNSSEALGGNGVYSRDSKEGQASESVAFFIGKETFVYTFGAMIEAPTERVARAIFRAALSGGP